MPLFSFRMGEGGNKPESPHLGGTLRGRLVFCLEGFAAAGDADPPLCSLLGEVAIGGWAGRSYRRAPPGGSLGPLGRVDCETGDELSLALVTSHPAFIQVPLRAAFS